MWCDVMLCGVIDSVPIWMQFGFVRERGVFCDLSIITLRFRPLRTVLPISCVPTGALVSTYKSELFDAVVVTLQRNQGR